jgi:hypothetical protein
MPCLRAPSPSRRVAICPSREKPCCSGVRLRALSLSQRYEEMRTKDDERHDDGKLLLGFTWMAPSTQEPSSLLPQQLIIIIIMSPPHCCIHACSRQQHCTPSSLDAASLQQAAAAQTSKTATRASRHVSQFVVVSCFICQTTDRLTDSGKNSNKFSFSTPTHGKPEHHISVYTACIWGVSEPIKTRSSEEKEVERTYHPLRKVMQSASSWSCR